MRLDEALTESAGFHFVGAQLLESTTTQFQSLELWEIPQFGKVLRIDDCFMTSERDEFFYHENLVHPAAITHPAPARALIIGGGDGGAAEELFKYPTLQHITLVELDPEVVALSRRHLSAIHRGSLDDPRLDLQLMNAHDYVRRKGPLCHQRFDLILLDLTDPVGPAAELYTEQFLHDCKALLTSNGAIALHLGAPWFHPERIHTLHATLTAVYRYVRPYLTYVPLYGSLWAMACASDQLDPSALDPREVDQRITARGLYDLQYYNGATHRAAQALPNFLRALLDTGPAGS